MIRAFLHRASWQLMLTVVALITVVALALLWALRTQGGAVFAIEQIAARVPGTLTVGATRGSLAQGLTLSDVSYADDAGLQVAIGTARLDFALLPLLQKQLQVNDLALEQVRVTRPPAGAPAPLEVPALSAPLEVSVAAFAVTDLVVVSGTESIQLTSLQGALDWRDDTLNLQSVQVVAPAWQIDTTLSLRLDDVTGIDGQLGWQLTGGDVNGRAQLAGSLRALQIEHVLHGPLDVATNGQMILRGQTTPQLTLTHTCASGCASADVTITDLVVSQTGTLEDYAFDLRATARSKTLPPVQIAAGGRGSLQQLRFATLTATSAAGNVNASGALQFAPGLAFDAKGRATNVDASLVHASLTGRVATGFSVRGSAADAFSASLQAMRGTLNGYALSADAKVKRSGTSWTFSDVAASVGDNRLTGNGSLTPKRVTLDADIDARDLAQLSAQLGGAVSAQVSVRGTPDAPVIAAKVDGENIVAASVAIGSLSLTASTDASGALSGNAALDKLTSAGRELGSTRVQLGGTTGLINADVSWMVADNDVQFTANVTPSREGLIANITGGTVSVAPVGTWQLDAPFDATLKPGLVSISANTWRNADASISIERIALDGRDVDLAAALADMPLNPVNAFITPTLRVSGRVDASVNVSRRGKLWSGSVDWQQRDTALRYTGDGADETLNLTVVSLTADLDDTRGALNFDVQGDHAIQAQGRFTVADAVSAPTLDGSASLEMSQLEWLARVVPGTNDLAGSLSVNVTASGALAKPRLDGRLDWRDGALSLTDLGIRLSDIQLQGEGDSSSSVKIAGTAASGGGNLTMRGEIERPLDPARRLRLEIDGDNLKVVEWDGYKVWVSPDLALTIDQAGTQVSGAIDVPRADIKVKELPKGAVARSADIRVEGVEDERAMRLPVTGTIDVTLGSAVHVEALGLNSDVRGDIKVTLKQGLEPRFDGRLYLENGEFKAYGQQLTVNRGNLFYAGSIRNPNLDVQASRSITDGDGTVVAGVRVTGPADNYRVDIYSEPALPSTEALAYLMLGRSSFQASGADGEALSQTALALGMSRSSPLTTQIASGLGLDELSVAGGNLDDAELVAGKQLNDDLYVRFTYGVFSELGALLLRYRLSKRLSIEVGSAETQSVDLLYSIEK